VLCSSEVEEDGGRHGSVASCERVESLEFVACGGLSTSLVGLLNLLEQSWARYSRQKGSFEFKFCGISMLKVILLSVGHSLFEF
jgi:hypothetical protein